MSLVRTTPNIPLPSFKAIATFLATSPLYSTFATLAGWNAIQRVVDGQYGVDAYCKVCSKESTFVFDGRVPLDYTAAQPGGTYTLVFRCPRCKVNRAYFSLVIETNESIRKIGQIPSVADCAQAELRAYDKIIEAEQVADLRHAVGLASHGIGAGSLIYLRRIFERLIKQARETARSEQTWDDELFAKSRMDERIKLLRHHLPEFLVDNRKIYGILSAGVHNLSEEECLSLFPVVRTGIELILDEQAEKRRREKKIKATADELDKIRSQLENRPSSEVEDE